MTQLRQTQSEEEAVWDETVAAQDNKEELYSWMVVRQEPAVPQWLWTLNYTHIRGPRKLETSHNLQVVVRHEPLPHITPHASLLVRTPSQQYKTYLVSLSCARFNQQM